jgi:hypothetical protein
MTRQRRRSGSGDLFDLVVRNALDFLEHSVSDLPKQPKYSLVHFCSALELFLKARLMLDHWALIVAKPESANLVKFRAGDFRSVSMDDAIQRLRNVAAEPISPDEESCFRTVRDHRNKLVHFFHEQYTASPPDERAIQEVVSQQCKAWFYLHRSLTGRWMAHFKPYAAQIEKLNEKMQENRVFLRAKYEAISPEVSAEIEAGVEYGRCYSCGFDATRIEERVEPLYEAACRVCGSDRHFLRVSCPECGETITVEDMGEAECPNDDFTTDIEWLVEKYGPHEDPKEDTRIGYCSYCERTDTPTAIPFGDFEYLCLSCLGMHDSADNCDWCGALNASLGEHSYLSGCVVCGGKFSSESFLRE